MELKVAESPPSMSYPSDRETRTKRRDEQPLSWGVSKREIAKGPREASASHS